MKLKRKHYVLTGIVLIPLAIWLIFFSLPLTYSAKPIAGQVVDAETGKPLEGAIVIALWELERGFGLEGSIIAGRMEVTEVLTDAKGYYSIPGWGPKWRPKGTHLGHNAPLLVAFKDGYDFFAEGNSYESIFKDTRRRWAQESTWNMETIKLKKFKGNLREYYSRLMSLSDDLTSVLDYFMGAKDCDWQTIPQTILMFDRYYKRLKVEIPANFYLIPSVDNLVARKICGTKEEFIRRYDNEKNTHM